MAWDETVEFDGPHHRKTTATDGELTVEVIATDINGGVTGVVNRWTDGGWREVHKDTYDTLDEAYDECMEYAKRMSVAGTSSALAKRTSSLKGRTVRVAGKQVTFVAVWTYFEPEDWQRILNSIAGNNLQLVDYGDAFDGDDMHEYLQLEGDVDDLVAFGREWGFADDELDETVGNGGNMPDAKLVSRKAARLGRR